MKGDEQVKRAIGGEKEGKGVGGRDGRLGSYKYMPFLARPEIK